MTRATLEPIHDPTFLFEETVCESLANEALELHATSDLGPTDALPIDLQQLEYDLFFGRSPLSTPPTSTPTSRSTSPLPSAAVPAARVLSSTDEVQTKPSGNSKKRRTRAKSHAKRKVKRKRNRENNAADPYWVRDTTFDKYLNSAVAAGADVPIDYHAASSGYVGIRDRRGDICDLQNLLNSKGFKRIQWDGRNPKPVTDASGKIVAVLVGTPEAPDWRDVHRGAFEAIISSRGRCDFPKNAVHHRRGKFPALAFGISHGGGRKCPGNLFHDDRNAHELSKLRQNNFISRIAGNASASFAAWAPKLYSYYEDHLHALLKHDPTLRRNFPHSVWAAATVNFGPRTITRRHRDSSNLPYGWCGITALGEFDATKGGHLVLWDLKLVVEFPAGSTILLPSAAIAHSNVPINNRERRCSFTQYTAGGLFRWVEQGFQKSEDYLAGLGDNEREEEAARTTERCKLGLSLFSTLETLPTDQAARKMKYI